MEAKIGVITAGEVNMPAVSTGGKMFGADQPSTWASIFFVVAVVYLFAVL